jgi:hypothetical protein
MHAKFKDYYMYKYFLYDLNHLLLTLILEKFYWEKNIFDRATV